MRRIYSTRVFLVSCDACMFSFRQNIRDLCDFRDVLALPLNRPFLHKQYGVKVCLLISNRGKSLSVGQASDQQTFSKATRQPTNQEGPVW